ncbi:ABC transporter ATP-binding protein [Couchioplanes caeruleus]|uniref:ATP-binding cassette domain-containing protein n=1 Tax=Couchioplanes caeruleus TaxID=56438 RepID=UPI0020BE2F14|nr:ABC transporter ATP-binding protein [Couchioplanes caeruleus]UQU66188.1 ABC transporter ATP-binding protein [Couchioplanes caeruleus]
MISLRDLTVRYGDTVAVDGLTTDLEPGKIYGLLGRNGSGKTSLLSVLAAYRKAAGGSLTVNGVDPFENAQAMRDTVFVRDVPDVPQADRVGKVLGFHARLRPRWDAAYADHLAAAFGLDRRKRVSALSRGQRSALGVVVGLATRAPLTILDEAYLGMDAVARSVFQRELLADYLAHPRTIILSTHLIQEVADLFEEVLILDRGRLIVQEDTDTFRSRGVAVTGPEEAVETFVSGRTVLARQSLGGVRQATLYGSLDDDEQRRAGGAGLTLEPVGIQDLFVHLTSAERTPEAVR